jgi:hypothetical protein
MMLPQPNGCARRADLFFALSSEKNWMHPYKVSRAGAPVFGSMKLPSQDDGREGTKV